MSVFRLILVLVDLVVEFLLRSPSGPSINPTYRSGPSVQSTDKFDVFLLIGQVSNTTCKLNTDEKMKTINTILRCLHT